MGLGRNGQSVRIFDEEKNQEKTIRDNESTARKINTRKSGVNARLGWGISKMKVFISWSGERSQMLGQALYDWIPMVLQSSNPWLSKADIEAGERWGDKVAKELEECNFGILCLTKENLASPWILFEAGALAKLMQEGRVIPLLLDIDFRDISGPLTQFQAKKADHDGILDIVTAINNLSEIKLQESQLHRQFMVLWSTLLEQIKSIPEHASPSKTHRPQQEVLEELVSSVRGLDIRFRQDPSLPPEFRKRRRLLNPMMIKEIFHISDFIGANDDGTFLFLMLAGMVRDEIPWLYELAVDAYHQSIENTHRAKAARACLFAAIRSLQKARFLDVFDSKEMYMFVKEICRLVERYDFNKSNENQKYSEVPMQKLKLEKDEFQSAISNIDIDDDFLENRDK